MLLVIDYYRLFILNNNVYILLYHTNIVIDMSIITLHYNTIMYLVLYTHIQQLSFVFSICIDSVTNACAIFIETLYVKY